MFHREGRVIRDFRATWAAACAAVGLPRLLFRDLRRSGARNYRRAGVTEDVIQRIGGWKTKSMFARYNVVDERDLAEAGERLAAFLTDAAPTPPTVVSLRASRRRVQSELRGQNTDISADSTLAPASPVAVSS